MKKLTLQQQADKEGVSRPAIWLRTEKGKAYRKTDKYKAYQKAYQKRIYVPVYKLREAGLIK